MTADSGLRSFSWRDALRESRLVSSWGELVGRLRAFLAPWLGTSFVARHADTWLVWAGMLLAFALPVVGTGTAAVLTWVFFAAAIWHGLVRPGGADAGAPRPFDVLVLLGILVSFIAVVASPYLGPSLKGFAKGVVYWAGFVAWRRMVGSVPGGGRAFLAALFAGALIQGVYGIYQWTIHVPPLALWDDADAEVQLTRVYGSLRNPNLLSGYLLPIIPVAIAGALSRGHVAFRTTAALTALAGTACLYFTYSRGAFLGLFAALGVMGLVAGQRWLGRAGRRGVVTVAVVAVLGGLLAWFAFQHAPGLQERLASITATRTHSSNSFRMNVWIGVLQMLHDSWWFGVGVGNDAFRKAYALYMVTGFEALGAYNIFLEEAVEKGLLGLVVFLGLFAGAFIQLVRHIRRTGAWVAAAGIMAALTGIAIHGLVDTVFYRPAVQLVFWALLACASHPASLERGEA
ncbi:MAG: O-antigen ligase family protein [bacterium]|nr:O-antigen ligase family protein [bacterium]